MKTKHAWILYTGLALSCLAAEKEEAAVTERGPHQRTIETIKRETLPDGTVLEQKSRQVELATGMHYWDNGAWAEAQELIEPAPGGAVAHHGQHKAAFAANFNTRGAIQVVDADGNRFTSHVLGLALTDATSGQSVMVAETKNSIGQILPPNQIVYSDAFTGIKADVRYTYTRSGIEQDIILREALPVTPADQQMNPATTRLEVFTEFLEAPGGTITDKPLRVETDLVKRQAMALPDFVDQELNFGPMGMGPGKAIDFQGVVADEIPVAKSWEIREGRTFLIEGVEFPSVQPALEALPEKEAKLRTPVRNGAVRQAANKSLVRPFPAAPKQQAAANRKPMGRMASLNLRPGVLLDYALTLSGGLTNFVFRPEATHSVSGTVNLYGTNTIVGGTIVKYAVGGILSFNGNIVCDTTPYHPAVFTASTDNTMGDTVTAGSPSGFYATAALRASGTVTGELHDLRFSYANTAVDWFGSAERFYNLQFVNCSNAIRRVNATNAPLHNLLITNVLTVFTGSNSMLLAQHVTAHTVRALSGLPSGAANQLTLTNCILFNVTNTGSGTVQLDYVATNGSTSLPTPSHGWPVSAADFQICAGGYHYLTTNSALHDVGTTNIATNLLAELTLLTTFAPQLLATTTSVAVMLSPFAGRDIDMPDLGYHYAPLDYILRGYRLNTNAVLTMTNGVAIGIDYNGQSWGLIFDGATNISIGSPTNMNHFVRAHNVQELSTGNPTTRAMFYDFGNSGTHGDSELRYRFTDIAAMVNDGYAVYSGKNWINWEWSHCWVYNLSIIFTASKGSQTFGLTNNIFQWSDATLQRSGSSSVFHLRNNLFRKHNSNVADLNSSSTIRDNLFDTGLVYTNGTTVSHSYNAFYLATNGTSYATNALPGLDHNLPLTSLTYQTDPYGRYGPYGRFYQPSNSILINAGSQNATNAGLYHFTTTTNLWKETNSVVDIGPHYVALNASGNPQDYDGDGVPDYYEDRNGNGSWDAGELNWQNADTDGDGVNDGLEMLQGRNPMGGTVANTNNTLNLRVFTPLK